MKHLIQIENNTEGLSCYDLVNQRENDYARDLIKKSQLTKSISVNNSVEIVNNPSTFYPKDDPTEPRTNQNTPGLVLPSIKQDSIVNNTDSKISKMWVLSVTLVSFWIRQVLKMDQTIINPWKIFLNSICKQLVSPNSESLEDKEMNK